MNRPAVATIAALVLAAGCSNSNSAVDFEDPAQRASYAQGFVLGEQGQGLPLDADAFVAGVRAGLTDRGELSPEELSAAMAEFQNLMAEARRVEGAAALEEGEEFLAENGGREGVMTTASGVQYEVIRDGDGPRPVVTDTVLVHYRGELIDGTVFDESYSRGEPSDFQIGMVVPGFAEGLQLMPVGSQYKFYIPGPLGYGENPRPGGAIGPNDLLIFEVEMLEILDR